MWRWEISKAQKCNNYQTEPWPSSANGSEMCRGKYTDTVLSPIRNSAKHIKLFSTHLPISRSLKANSGRYLRQTPVLRLTCCHFPWRLSLVTSSLFRDVMQLGVELVTDIPGQRIGPVFFKDVAWPFQTRRYTVLKLRWPTNNLRRTTSKKPPLMAECKRQEN